MIGGSDDVRGAVARRGIPGAAVRASVGEPAGDVHDPARPAADRVRAVRARRPGRPACAGAEGVTLLAARSELTKRFGGVHALHDVSLSVEAGGNGRTHGRQRRRQDDAVQPHRRARAPDRRRHPLPRRVDRWPAPGPDLPARHRPHVPDRAAVLRADRARQRGDRGPVRRRPGREPTRRRTNAPSASSS